MKILDLVTKEKREMNEADPMARSLWFQIDPDKVYPATLALFVGAKKDPEAAKTIPLQYRNMALSFSNEEIAKAGAGKAATREDDPAWIERRAVILDTARLVFTEMLHEAIEHKPMGVHILKHPQDAWRINPR